MLDMTKENIQPQRIKQDVLILSAKDDHFIPIKMHKMMIKSLKNAKSVKGIIYTKETHAHNHCHIGNIGLAIDTVIKWIQEKQKSEN